MAVESVQIEGGTLLKRGTASPEHVGVVLRADDGREVAAEMRIADLLSALQLLRATKAVADLEIARAS